MDGKLYQTAIVFICSDGFETHRYKSFFTAFPKIPTPSSISFGLNDANPVRINCVFTDWLKYSSPLLIVKPISFAFCYTWPAFKPF